MGPTMPSIRSDSQPSPCEDEASTAAACPPPPPPPPPPTKIGKGKSRINTSKGKSKQQPIPVCSDDDFVLPNSPTTSRKEKNVEKMNVIFEKFNAKLQELGVTEEMFESPM